jgi:hypothetical protein
MDRVTALSVIALLAASLAMPVWADSAVSPVSDSYLTTDSRSKAEVLWRAGELERAHLFPLDGGGEDVDVNVVYVPKVAAEAKAKLDRHIMKLAELGKVADYEAAPEYLGESFVPRRIVVKAMDDAGAVVMLEVIEIW